MNKRYMDFVPKEKAVEETAGRVLDRPVVHHAVKKPVAKKPLAKRNIVKKEVAKVEPAKAKVRPAKTGIQTSGKVKNVIQDMPRPAFVNVEKVKKRPLSKNVYQKKVVEIPEEIPSGPVTIIDKPEKDSKVGLVVTIIITIILGAAAGTVAFLLLPK